MELGLKSVAGAESRASKLGSLVSVYFYWDFSIFLLMICYRYNQKVNMSCNQGNIYVLYAAFKFSLFTRKATVIICCTQV